MKQLNYLIRDEKKAPRDYSRLIPLLKRKSEIKMVRKIMRDERKHAHLLNKIRRKYN